MKPFDEEKFELPEDDDEVDTKVIKETIQENKLSEPEMEKSAGQ